jgi:hypothetical protein
VTDAKTRGSRLGLRVTAAAGGTQHSGGGSVDPRQDCEQQDRQRNDGGELHGGRKRTASVEPHQQRRDEDSARARAVKGERWQTRASA